VPAPRQPKGPPVAVPDRQRSVEQDREDARARYERRGAGRNIEEDGRQAFAIAGSRAVVKWYRENILPMADAVRSRKPLPTPPSFEEWVKRALVPLGDFFRVGDERFGTLRRLLDENAALTGRPRDAVEFAQIEEFVRVRDELLAGVCGRIEWTQDPPFPLACACLEVTRRYEQRKKGATMSGVLEPLRAYHRQRGTADEDMPPEYNLMAMALGMTAQMRLRPRRSRGHPIDESHEAFLVELAQRFGTEPSLDDVVDLWIWHAHERYARARKSWSDRFAIRARRAQRGQRRERGRG